VARPPRRDAVGRYHGGHGERHESDACQHGDPEKLEGVRDLFDAAGRQDRGHVDRHTMEITTGRSCADRRLPLRSRFNRGCSDIEHSRIWVYRDTIYPGVEELKQVTWLSMAGFVRDNLSSRQAWAPAPPCLKLGAQATAAPASPWAPVRGAAAELHRGVPLHATTTCAHGPQSHGVPDD
jgi:hypothetical protein